MLEVFILVNLVSHLQSVNIFIFKLHRALVDGGYCYGFLIYLDILYSINIQNKQLINILLIAVVRILSTQE